MAEQMFTELHIAYVGIAGSDERDWDGFLRHSAQRIEQRITNLSDLVAADAIEKRQRQRALRLRLRYRKPHRR